MNKKISLAAIVLSVLAVIIALWSVNKLPAAISSQKEDTLARILKTNTLTICYATWPPSVIKDPNTGELSGFLIDAIKRIAEDASLKLAYVESSWGGFAADINTGKCDAGVAGFYPMINRSTAVAFTQPFYFAGNNGVVKSGDNRFKKIQDLNRADIKIAVIQGEYADTYAKKYLPKAQLLVLESSADNTAPLVAVSAGQADVGLIMADVTKGYAKTHLEVRELFAEPYSVTPISWATRQADQQLLNFLTNGINYLESTGELDALAKKYNSTWFTEKKNYQLLAQ
ncbi:MAG: ABC transporter substrate-binding protein [Patescibacteria group bacterium]